MSEARYRMNSPMVIGEVIDGEAVIVNLETGMYYSMNLSGSLIWEQLVAGATPRETQKNIQSIFNGKTDAVVGEVENFIRELQAESLIIDRNGTPIEPSPLVLDKKDLPFEKPQLNKFSDMVDLLLLDPIHDVDESGWPHAKPK